MAGDGRSMDGNPRVGSAYTPPVDGWRTVKVKDIPTSPQRHGGRYRALVTELALRLNKTPPSEALARTMTDKREKDRIIKGIWWELRRLKIPKALTVQSRPGATTGEWVIYVRRGEDYQRLLDAIED